MTGESDPDGSGDEDGTVQVTPDSNPARRDDPGPATDPSAESFGRYGWVLVGVLVVSLLVVPWTIILVPRAQGFLESFGLGLRDAYLVLPMIPALLLGAVAVWTAIANDERRR